MQAGAESKLESSASHRTDWTGLTGSPTPYRSVLKGPRCPSELGATYGLAQERSLKDGGLRPGDCNSSPALHMLSSLCLFNS